MKKYSIILSFLMLASLPLLSISCTNDNQVFDEQGKLRMDKQIQKIKTDLQNASNGWVMRYYPDETRVGGFVFLLDFSADNVQIQSDFTNQIEESSFKVYGGEGPVLSFNEYNPLHLLADPAVEPFGIGYKGDFEFVVMESSSDSIVLKGRKWNKRVTLYPATQTDWDGISKLRDNEEILAPVGENVPFYRNIYVDGNPVATFLYKFQNRFLEYFFTDQNGVVRTGRKAVSFTNDGFELQSPIDINGTIIKNFKTNETLDGFTFGSNGELKIENHAVVTFTKAWEKIFNNDYLAVTQTSPDFYKLVAGARQVEPDFSSIVLFWNLGTNYLKSVSFVFDDKAAVNRQIRYYHAAIGEIQNPAEDQSIFRPITSGGNYVYYYGGFANPTELTKYFINNTPESANFKAMANLFFEPEGYTIIPNADGNYYLVSNLRSNYWMLFSPVR
jgi:hypothetical protein